MKDYTEYNIEDFASDERFIKWCLEPNEPDDDFWASFLFNFPDKSEIIEEAKVLVLSIHEAEKSDNYTALENEVWKNLEQEVIPETIVNKVNPFLRRIASVAAVLIAICAVFVVTNILGTEATSSTVAQEWINYQNNSGVTKTIQLADGSSVEVEPFGTLKYPTAFTGDQRVVFMKGEAFFEIIRDENKPFMVYANETITKVLGTSFRIFAFEGEKTVEVDVKTGKVAVYAQVTSENNEKAGDQIVVKTDEVITIPRPNKKLEVTPNQKVVFDRTAEKMVKTLTEKPLMLAKPEEIKQFQFNNESIVKVFNALEKAYGIDLEFDDNKFQNCTITTKLDDEPLTDKLSIICLALGLEFTEKEATIFISGEGC
ncbi:MAG: FecR domain-containing protein [Bacteroidota bacterium]